MFGTTLDRIKLEFMKLVDRRPNGCWIWRGTINASKGYGVASFGGKRGFLAHRVAHVLFTGPIPRGLLVLHTCDVRRCVNPDHFFLGTDMDNAADSMRKLRKPSKLTVRDVLRARRMYFHNGMSQRAIADIFGVTQPNMCHVLRGSTWSHV